MFRPRVANCQLGPPPPEWLQLRAGAVSFQFVCGRMSLYDLLASVRGLGGGGGGGGAAGGAGGPPAAPAVRARSQSEQELVTWHAIKAWVAKEKLKIAREEEYARFLESFPQFFSFFRRTAQFYRFYQISLF